MDRHRQATPNVRCQPLFQIDPAASEDLLAGTPLEVKEHLIPAMEIFFDFTLLRERLTDTGPSSGCHCHLQPCMEHVKDIKDDPVCLGKRKAELPLEQGRTKQVKTTEDEVISRRTSPLPTGFSLFSTSCLFQLEPLLDMPACGEDQVLSDTDLGPVLLSESPCESLQTDAVVADSMIELSITTSQGNGSRWQPLCRLPIIDTKSHIFPTDCESWRSPNGQWILSALRLNGEGIIHLEAKASLDFGGTVLRLSLAGSLGSKVHLAGADDLSNVPVLSMTQILDIVEMMRFTSPTSGPNEEEQRRRGIDASAIYANLAPANFTTHGEAQSPGLRPILYPFQERSTAFLLGREGKEYVKGVLMNVANTVMTRGGPSDVGIWWELVCPNLFFNVCTGQFAANAKSTQASNTKGALLAEEMGLGKTVEILALILGNPAPADRSELVSYTDQANDVTVRPVKATLIVAPEVLREQWINEIRRHAPDLKIYCFQGHVKAYKDVPSGSSWERFAQTFDVIVVSFGVLQKEIGVALKEPVRSRRSPRRYERPRCPLIQLEFWRVVCDEIQMVSNTSQAGRVVSMVPRLSSIAVSGTPFKKSSDIASLFHFLRLQIPQALAKQPISCSMAPSLFRALSILTVRNKKTDVSLEMTLPKQQRYVVPIDFTAVEMAYYEGLWTHSLHVLGLDAHGGPLRRDWSLDSHEMRNQLFLLRQACTHPQVAGRALGSGAMAHGNLKTLEEVLIFMQEQVAGELHKERSRLFALSIDRITIVLLDEALAARHDLAKVSLEYLLSQLDELRQQTRDALRAARHIGPGYRFTSREITCSQFDQGEELLDSQNKSVREAARVAHIQTLQQRYRAYTEHAARASHWLGSVHFQMSELTNNVEQKDRFKQGEDHAYDRAEQYRMELLSETREGVARAVKATEEISVVSCELEEMETTTPFDNWGLKTRRIFEQVKAGIQLLNQNTEVVTSWRRAARKALFTPVNREVSADDADDDQYAEALECQHQAEVLLEMYRPLLARRQAILTSQIANGSMELPNSMKDLESSVRFFKQQRRQALLRGGTPSVAHAVQETDLDVLAEHERAQLAQYRLLAEEMNKASITQLHDSRALADLLPRLREISEEEGGSLKEDRLAQEGMLALRAILKRQSRLLEGLRRELDVMAKLFNRRAEYFKQLQALSDALLDAAVPSAELGLKLEELQRRKDAAALASKNHESRLRYLCHLEEIGNEGVEKDCVICRDPMEIGLLFKRCSHTCCAKCFNTWYSSSHTCPTCRAPVKGPKDYHRIVYLQNEDKLHPTESHPSSDVLEGAEAKSAAFRTIDARIRLEIEEQKPSGRYGSKLDMLTKHLIFIGQESPLEKTIVFSAFKRGLDLVADALRHSESRRLPRDASLLLCLADDPVPTSRLLDGLRFAYADSSGRNTAIAVREFTTGDTSILLLHSETTSAGLNLVATKNVILLEPLVNSGTERQALGRVSRIGQTKETNVFLYFLKGSVEERILHLAAGRGQSLYLRDQEQGQERDSGALIAGHGSGSGNTREKGDYVHTIDDLLSCFFAEHLGAGPGSASSTAQRLLPT